MRTLIQTALSVSLLSYGVFIIADYVRPGFVSYVFSVHLFLIPILLFGTWHVFIKDEEVESEGRIGSAILKGIISITLFVLLWREGGVFGDLRLVVAACGLFLPWIVSGLAGQGALGQDEDI